MATSQYNGDSPFPSPFSEHPGMSGSPETLSVKPAAFPVIPAIEASSMPARYILDGAAALYIGESIDCARRLRDHGTADPTQPLGSVSPTTLID